RAATEFLRRSRNNDPAVFQIAGPLFDQVFQNDGRRPAGARSGHSGRNFVVRLRERARSGDGAGVGLQMIEDGEWGIGSGEWGQKIYFPLPPSPLPIPHSPSSNPQSAIRWAISRIRSTTSSTVISDESM